MIIGITGSTGFIGLAVADFFRTKGDKVFALDSLVHPDNKTARVSLPGRLDWVFHFGATRSIEGSFKDPIEVYRRNMHSTMAALDIALSKKAKFLYMSSYVYGKPKYLPVDERHPESVLNPYMGSKLLGEQLCRFIHECFGLSVMILRGFTLYGPNQKDDQLISSIVNSVKNKKNIIINDPGTIRDHLYISDFTRLAGIIARCGFSGFEIYNIGSGTPYKNIDVARIANKLAGEPVRIVVKMKKRKNDISKCFADIKKVKRDLKWQPKVSLVSGLRDCICNTLLKRNQP